MLRNKVGGERMMRLGMRTMSKPVVRMGARMFLGPPRNSYIAIRNPLQLWWHHKVSSNFKYFGIIVASAFTLTHVHANTLLTVGPPVAVAGYFGIRALMKHRHHREATLITQADQNDQIRIKKYDESEIYNVVNGLENQYDHFTHQVLEVVERRIVDYMIDQKTHDPHNASPLPFFMDKDQFSVYMDNNPETFVVLKVGASEFIKLSVAFFDSKSQHKKRVGTIEVRLLEKKEEDKDEQKYLEYVIGIDVVPYGFGTKVTSITGNGTTNSKILQESEKEFAQDEITVNI